MIPTTPEIEKALRSGRFFYADLIEVNIGDAYGNGKDEILRLTNAGHDIDYGGIYKSTSSLQGAAQLSRKEDIGSDEIEIQFSATDEAIVEAIAARKYMNKQTKVSRVFIDEDGKIISNTSIPIRTAVAVAHEIDTSAPNPTITLLADTVLGALRDKNVYLATTEDHEKRGHIGDMIFKYAAEAREYQKADEIRRSSHTLSGAIEPDAISVCYGQTRVSGVHAARIMDYTEDEAVIGNKDNRYYRTRFVLVLSAGQIDDVDFTNIEVDGDKLNLVKSSNPNNPTWSRGGWTAHLRTDGNNSLDARTDPNLEFFRWNMNRDNLDKLKGMYGKGLSVLWISRVHKQHREKGYTGFMDEEVEFKIPVIGRSVLDPRDDSRTPSANPALILKDYLEDSAIGAGETGVSVDDGSVVECADWYETQLTFLDDVLPVTMPIIEIGIEIPSANSFATTFEMFAEAANLYISDYGGFLKMRAEKPGNVVMSFDESELIGGIDFTGGNLEDRVNQCIVTVEVPKILWFGDKDQSYVSYDAIYPQGDTVGKGIRDEWLKEDGYRNLTKDFSSESIFRFGQAIFLAAVEARKGRVIDECEIVAPPIAYLLEPGDIIEITSEVAEMNKRQWRVKEVSEDDGEIELSLVDYDPVVYSTDFNKVPDPDFPATAPDADSIGQPSNLQIRLYDGDQTGSIDQNFQGEATWNAPTENVDSLSHYTVIVEDTEAGRRTLVNEQTEIHYLSNLTAGSTYNIGVQAVTERGAISPMITTTFTAGNPPPPTKVEIEAGPTSFVARPSLDKIVGRPQDVTFVGEFREKKDSNPAPWYQLGRAPSFSVDGLRPSTTYEFRAFTWTPIGQSDTATKVNVTTGEAADIWVGAVWSDNGLSWTRDENGIWLPNTNPKTITAKFSKPSEGEFTATAVATLDTGSRKFKVVPGAGNPSRIEVVILPGANQAVSQATVEFTLKEADGSASLARVSAPITLTVSGGTGPAGENGRTIHGVYRTSDTQPLPPSGTNPKPPGWSLDPPAVIPDGHFTWVSYTTKTLDPLKIFDEWTSPGKLSGNKGSPGDDGLNGRVVRACYFKNPTAPPTPGGTTIPPADWTEEPPTDVNFGDAVWVSYTDAPTIGSPTGSGNWTVPGRFSGNDGSDGSDGSDGERGSKHAYILNARDPGPSGDAWLDSEADDYFSKNWDGKKHVWDQCTQYNDASGKEWTLTKYWTGGVWTEAGEVVDGDVIINGSIKGEKIYAKTIDASKIDVRTINVSEANWGDNVGIYEDSTGGFDDAHMRIKVGTNASGLEIINDNPTGNRNIYSRVKGQGQYGGFGHHFIMEDSGICLVLQQVGVHAISQVLSANGMSRFFGAPKAPDGDQLPVVVMEGEVRQGNKSSTLTTHKILYGDGLNLESPWTVAFSDLNGDGVKNWPMQDIITEYKWYVVRIVLANNSNTIYTSAETLIHGSYFIGQGRKWTSQTVGDLAKRWWINGTNTSTDPGLLVCSSTDLVRVEWRILREMPYNPRVGHAEALKYNPGFVPGPETLEQ